MKHAASFLGLAIFLGACGGGGEGGPVLPSGPAGYVSLVQEGLDIAAASEGYEPVSSLPTSSGATYTGIMILAQDTEGAGTGYTGDVSLVADFTSGGSMSGSASGFYEGTFDIEGNPTSPGTLKSGTLSLSSPSLNTGLFDMTVTGSLAVEGTSERNVTGTLDAGFAGAGGTNPDAVVASGTLMFSGATSNYETLLIAN